MERNSKKLDAVLVWIRDEPESWEPVLALLEQFGGYIQSLARRFLTTMAIHDYNYIDTEEILMQLLIKWYTDGLASYKSSKPHGYLYRAITNLIRDELKKKYPGRRKKIKHVVDQVELQKYSGFMDDCAYWPDCHRFKAPGLKQHEVKNTDYLADTNIGNKKEEARLRKNKRESALRDIRIELGLSHRLNQKNAIELYNKMHPGSMTYTMPGLCLKDQEVRINDKSKNDPSDLFTMPKSSKLD